MANTRELRINRSENIFIPLNVDPSTITWEAFHDEIAAKAEVRGEKIKCFYYIDHAGDKIGVACDHDLKEMFATTDEKSPLKIYIVRGDININVNALIAVEQQWDSKITPRDHYLSEVGAKPNPTPPNKSEEPPKAAPVKEEKKEKKEKAEKVKIEIEEVKEKPKEEAPPPPKNDKTDLLLEKLATVIMDNSNLTRALIEQNKLQSDNMTDLTKAVLDISGKFSSNFDLLNKTLNSWGNRICKDNEEVASLIKTEASAKTKVDVDIDVESNKSGSSGKSDSSSTTTSIKIKEEAKAEAKVEAPAKPPTPPPPSSPKTDKPPKKESEQKQPPPKKPESAPKVEVKIVEEECVKKPVSEPPKPKAQQTPPKKDTPPPSSSTSASAKTDIDIEVKTKEEEKKDSKSSSEEETIKVKIKTEADAEAKANAKPEPEVKPAALVPSTKAKVPAKDSSKQVTEQQSCFHWRFPSPGWWAERNETVFGEDNFFSHFKSRGIFWDQVPSIPCPPYSVNRNKFIDDEILGAPAAKWSENDISVSCKHEVKSAAPSAVEEPSFNEVKFMCQLLEETGGDLNKAREYWHRSL